MYPILFSIGKVNIYTHGVAIALGALLGGILIYFLGRKYFYHTTYIFDLVIYSLLGGLIGSRLLYVILYHDQFASFKEMALIWYGGLTSFGGILGGFLVAWLILKTKKEPILKWFDLGIIGFFVGWAFGRIGCLLSGDSLGIISKSSLAIWGRIPTQIFESIWAIIIAGICYLIFIRKKDWRLPDGFVFISGLGLYGLGRFIIDFFRDDSNLLFFFKSSQIISLIIFAMAAVIIFQILKRKRGDKNEGF